MGFECLYLNILRIFLFTMVCLFIYLFIGISRFTPRHEYLDIILPGSYPKDTETIFYAPKIQVHLLFTMKYYLINIVTKS